MLFHNINFPLSFCYQTVRKIDQYHIIELTTWSRTPKHTSRKTSDTTTHTFAGNAKVITGATGEVWGRYDSVEYVCDCLAYVWARLLSVARIANNIEKDTFQYATNWVCDVIPGMFFVSVRLIELQ